MRANTGTFSFLWPMIHDLDSAVAAARVGSTVAGLIALIAAGIASYQFLKLGTASDDLVSGCVGASLYAFLSFGIWKQWRWAAVCGLLLYWADQIAAISATRPGIFSMVVFVLFTLGFVSGLRGTFAAAKFKKASNETSSLDA